jgi:Nucleotide modification associated domain 5
MCQQLIVGKENVVMRLTNTIRKSIEEKVIQKAFAEKRESAINALAQKSLDYLVSTGWKLATEIPVGFEPYIRQTTYLYIERYKGVLWKKELRHLHLPKAVCDKIGTNPEITEEIYQHWDEVKSFVSIIDGQAEARKEIRAVLSSCTTSKQLSEVSPELYKFIPKESKIENLPVAVETLEKVNRLVAGIKE